MDFIIDSTDCTERHGSAGRVEECVRTTSFRSSVIQSRAGPGPSGSGGGYASA
jgi:hypothetical protein